MADRDFIIEVLLKARDETARAFASATAQMEGFNALADEQKKKLNELTGANKEAEEAHRRYVGQVKKGVDPQTRFDKELEKSRFQSVQVAEAYKKLEVASKRVNATTAQGTRDNADHVIAVDQQAKAYDNLVKKLQDHYGENKSAITQAARRYQSLADQNAILNQQTKLVEKNTRAQEENFRKQQSLLAQARTPAAVAADPTKSTYAAQRAEKELLAIRDKLARTTGDSERAERDLGEVRRDALRYSGFSSQAAVNYERQLKLVTKAETDAAKAKAERLKGNVVGGTSQFTTFERGASEISKFLDLDTSGEKVDVIQGKLNNASKSISNFTQGASGIGEILAVAIGPAITLITGMAGAFAAVGSAAIAAGTAVQTAFVSGLAEGLPVIGLFGAAMSRLQTVIGYAQQQYGLLQQKFIAGYQRAYDTALGINQVTIAEHNYSDTVFQSRLAVYQLSVAQLGLMNTRIQAARQLQDLTFAETNAKLAAEGASLSVAEAQKNLIAVIAQGGDVAAAQLQLHQAQASHTQAVVQSSRAAQDAARGSVARQEIQQSVKQASLGVEQAKRAIVDSQFALAQAHAAIIQAQQAYAGYNVQIAAQLAYLRSQMTSTERNLSSVVYKIIQLFQGVHGALRPVTDAILGAFVPLANKIYALFTNRRVFGALLTLANSIASSITRVSNAIFSDKSINIFIQLLGDAAKNLKPLTSIAITLFKSVQAIVVAANPYLHEFLNFLSHIAKQFLDWVDPKGHPANWIKQFFSDAFKAAEAFVKLGFSIMRLIAAVLGAGGGAKTGTALINSLSKAIDGVTNSINNHTGAWHTLQLLWSSIQPTLHALFTILGAIGKAFLAITTGASGQSALQGIANLLARVVIPAFAQFISYLGTFTSFLTGLFNSAPGLESALKTVLAIAWTSRVVFSGIKLLLAPLSIVLKMVSSVLGLFRSASALIGGIRSGGLKTLFSGKNPMQMAAERNVEAASGMQKAADTNLEAANRMAGAADAQGVAGDKQAGAAAVEETAATEQVAAATEQETAATEQGAGALASGGEAAAGGGLLSRLLGGGAAGAATTGLEGLSAAAGPLALIGGGGYLFGKLMTSLFHGAPLTEKQILANPSGFAQSTILSRSPQATSYALAGASNAQLPKFIEQLQKLQQQGNFSGFGNYLQKWLPTVQDVNVATASASSLAAIRTRAQELLQLPNISAPMRSQLQALVNKLDPVSVAFKKATAQWAQSFSGFDTSVAHVAKHVADQLGKNQDLINSNFKKNSSGWITQMTGEISAGTRKWQTLAKEGVKGTGQILDKLVTQLRQLTSSMGVNIPASIATMIVRTGQAGIQNFMRFLQGASSKYSGSQIQNFLKNSLPGLSSAQLKSLLQFLSTHGGTSIGTPYSGISFTGATGGPIAGYGGGDVVSAMLEPGEHVFTKEEVRSAGGHGAIYAIRRALGGGGQGGPHKYATGGQIGTTQILQGQNAPPEVLQNQGGQKTQGVVGWLGTTLANVQLFRKMFNQDWSNMWNTVYSTTKGAVNDEVSAFTNLKNSLNDIWQQINQNTSNSLKTFLDNMKNVLNQVTGDINTAFTYVQNATNASLKAFQSKPVSITLGSVPKFAEGGFLGKMGERGKDSVLAMLGRGEAVLNHTHQKVVEPALRSFYGFGLGEMFNRVRGVHAGDASPNGYAAGGYVDPVPGWSPSRIDQGVDGTLSSRGYLAPGNSRILISTSSDAGWAGGGYIAAQLLDGPYRGRIIYVAEGITPARGIRSGIQVSAGRQIATPVSNPYNQIVGNIETGWAGPGGGSPLAQSLPGYSGDQSVQATTAGASFNAFLMSLGAPGGTLDPGAAHPSSSLLKNYPAAALGSGMAGAIWKAVKQISVSGGGALGTLTQDVIKKVTDAANTYGQKQAGKFGGSQAVKALPGGWFRVGATLDPTMGQAPTYSAHGGFSFAELLTAGANAYLRGQDLAATLGMQNGQYGMPEETPLWARMPGASQMYKMWKNDVGSGQTGDPFFKVDLHQAIANALHWRPNQAIEVRRAALGGYIDRAKKFIFGSGGVVGPDDGSYGAIPIIAHAGEWVLNKAQQLKLAQRAGTTVDKLKQMLGFKGGPKSYQDGGEIDYSLDAGGSGGAGLGGAGQGQQHHHVQKPPNNLNIHIHVAPGPAEAKHAPPPASYDVPTHDTTGAYTPAPVSFETPHFFHLDLKGLLGANRYIANKIEKNGKDLQKGIDTFISNMTKATGDQGIFALAAQAVDNFVTAQQTALQFAEEGIKEVGQRLTSSAILTPLQAARQTSDSLRSQGKALQKTQDQEVTGLQQINLQLKRLGTPKTAAEKAEYSKLVSARTNLLNEIQTEDQKIAQNLQDQFDAATALLQANLGQTLRGTNTIGKDAVAAVARFAEGLSSNANDFVNVLNNVGPQIGAGLAQMAQTIANALGDPQAQQRADQAIIDAATAQREAIANAYEQAAENARSDPRWQTVADQLLGQLEQATTDVVQATAQALQDSITRADTKAQIQSSVIDMKNRIIAAAMALGSASGLTQSGFLPGGTLTPVQGIQAQLGVARQNYSNLQGQLQSYSDLLAQAQAEGNQGVVYQLQQKIDDLTAQLAEATVSIQQLNTSLHETAITMITSAQSNANGFFQSASSIIQTLGQITGSLNLPQLIRVAKETGVELRSAGEQIASQIAQSLSDPQTFGVFQSQVTKLLDPSSASSLTTAFLAGPTQFADLLAQIGPQIASLESLMPQDTGQLFQNLIQAMIDNTSSTVQNNLQLQQLNATTNQQQFTSSAWTLFRQAIFSGLGTLLPQYAMTVPKMDSGGMIMQSGLLYGHKGETISPALVSRGSALASSSNQENHFHFEEPMEVADPVYLGNAIAFRLNQDPNSR